MNGPMVNVASILVYDGDCGLCERAADVARRRAPGVTVRDHRTHGLDAIDAVIYVRGDRTLTGAPAIASLLRDFTGRGWRALGTVLGLPVVRIVAAGAYWVIARNRRRLSRILGLRACGLPQASPDL